MPEALTLRTLSDAIALRDALRAVSSMAVIGAGILGAEIASAARKYGVEATLVGREDRLGFGSVGTLLSDRLADLHAAHDVEILLNTEVADAKTASGRTTLTFGDGIVRGFDLVVAMIGARPNTRWLESSTVPLGDGVLCDSTGTAAPGVHAVGDVAAWADPATGRHARVEHQSNAIEQAVGVATRIVHGTPAEPPVPLFWSEIHGTRINAYGWFDPARPLSSDATTAVLTSRDAGDHVRGVVGWNATPREFRVARAAVSLPSSPQPSRPTDSVESAVHVEGATR
jgi:NADPH-dependent 2,4-dienoyl-CoA reductase/sulfur reductase-like enzyme